VRRGALGQGSGPNQSPALEPVVMGVWHVVSERRVGLTAPRISAGSALWDVFAPSQNPPGRPARI